MPRDANRFGIRRPHLEIREARDLSTGKVGRFNALVEIEEDPATILPQKPHLET